MNEPQEFLSPFRDGPTINFARMDSGRVRCEACQEESPFGVQTMRWVDDHVLETHPGWGEVRVERR